MKGEIGALGADYQKMLGRVRIIENQLNDAVTTLEL